MDIDTQLALQGTTIDTATPIRQAAADQRSQEAHQTNQMEATQRTLGQYYENLESREQARLSSTIAGAAQLKVFLDNNDVEGAKQFLLSRRQNLTNRIGAGESIDTQDTDAALQMLESGQLDQLKQTVDGLMAAGRVYGVTSTSGVGGATGELINRLRAEDPSLTVEQALQMVRGGAGQMGRNLANIQTGFDANYQTSAGSNQADLEYKPQIAEAQARGTALGGAQGQNESDYNDFMASVPALERTANRLYQVADRATYTLSGRAADMFQRELGFNPGDDATARAYYQNLVRTEILPILKQTFGAQFTEKEGEWLLATLGDVNQSAPEKRAAIRARVESWQNLAETMARRAGAEPQETFQDFVGAGGGATGSVRVVNPQTGEAFEISPDDLSAAEAEGFVRQ